MNMMTYLVRFSTPAFADALGDTKPEPLLVYVVVMDKNAAPEEEL